MSKYKEFIHGNAPEESNVPEDGLIGTYFKHLRTYSWIQGNPRASAAMRNHPGVKLYRRSGWLLFWLWIGILMIHSCVTN